MKLFLKVKLFHKREPLAQANSFTEVTIFTQSHSTTYNGPSNSQADQGPKNDSPNEGQKTNLPMIIGIAVAAAVLIFVCLLVAFYFARNKKKVIINEEWIVKYTEKEPDSTCGIDPDEINDGL